MTNITDLVAPGGLFITAALRRCRSYLVGDKRFPSANVDEHDLQRVLARGFSPRVQERELNGHEAQGYSSIVLAHARRRAGGLRPARRTVLRRTAAVTVLAAVVGLAAGPPDVTAMPLGERAGTARADREPATTRQRGITHRLRGRLGYGRLPGRQRVPSAEERRRMQRQFGQAVNPEPDPRPPGSPVSVAPKNGPAVLAVEPPPVLDAQRRSDPTDPPAPLFGAAGAAGERRPVARAAAADDYTLFRSIPVALGGPTLSIAEPSVANDRNGILYTGNVHAAISGDNGLSWNAINATTMFPTSAGYQNDGGYCCDQIAYAVDRGGYSLIFWLIQYSRNSDNQGRLRLVVFQGRKELLEQADFCTIDFVPSQFPNRGYAGNTWFDFNQMSATDEFLYISSKVEASSPGTFVDGLVWRLSLDELDDSDLCEGQTDRDRFSITSWSGDAAGFNPALVQNADSRMFWASHCKDDSDQDDNENECDGDDSQLVITEVPDSGTRAEITKRDVSRFELLSRGTGACPLQVAPPSDPCKRANDPVLTGYRSGGEVGWLWHVKQGGPDFVFPHVRVARFDTADVRLIDEHDIWNNGFAWVYPAIGVNSAGHIGLLANQIGLGFLPRPAVALIDDVAPDTDWESLTFHGIITSSHGTAGNVWGDYGQVRPYGDCTRTYAAAVHSQQGGTRTANSEHRFAWFGRERDGCADMTVVSLAAVPSEVKAGEVLLIGQTTRNIGSGTAGASETRYFLSRDASSSDDDLELEGETAVPELARGASHAAGDAAGVPGGLSFFPHLLGTYYLIGCADAGERVVEISNTNNCRVAEDTITVTSGLVATLTDVEVDRPVPALARRKRFAVSTELLRPAGARARTVSYYLSSAPRARASIRRIGTGRIPRSARGAQGQSRRVRVRHRLRGPASVPRRRQFLIACVGTRPRAERCLPARRAIYVVRSLSGRR